MSKRRNRSHHEYNDTQATLLMAVFGGTCAFFSVETIFPDVMESLGHQMSKLPGWKLHMGSMCVGILVFLIALFFLEVLETRSNITAWRSSAPWLPLAGLTAMATVIHIPLYIVVMLGGLCGVWAYRRTCSVRRSPHLP
jgi:hypothetical protein